MLRTACGLRTLGSQSHNNSLNGEGGMLRTTCGLRTFGSQSHNNLLNGEGGMLRTACGLRTFGSQSHDNSLNGEGGIRTLGTELPAVQQISNLPLSTTQPPLQWQNLL